jgi:hypothetical protein
LTTRQCFVVGALTSYSDLGFSVTDDISDPLPAAAGASITGISGITVQIISDVSVLITLPRALSTNPYLWYADNGNHGGNGNLCDSDATVSADSWSYTLGSGQAQVDNQPAYNGLPYPQNNWCMPFALPIVPG